MERTNTTYWTTVKTAKELVRELEELSDFSEIKDRLKNAIEELDRKRG